MIDIRVQRGAAVVRLLCKYIDNDVNIFIQYRSSQVVVRYIKSSGK